MTIQRAAIAILTDASGDFSTTLSAKDGRLLQYRYVPDGTAPLATGADLTIVGANSGIVFVSQSDIGTSAFTKAPRQATHDTAGAASLHASGGEPVEDFIYVGGEPLTVAIAQGGSEKAGTLHVWVG